jgi:hypothetical protein
MLQRTCNYERMNIYRLFAWAFTLGGGLFWTWVVFDVNRGPFGQAVVTSLAMAFPWLIVTFGAFILGLFFEQLTAALLFAAAGVTSIYGLVVRWEPGVWLQVGPWIILPMVIAAVLYLLAAQMQTTCELEDRLNKASDGEAGMVA